MRLGLKRPARMPETSLQLLNPQIAKGRLWALPPNVDRFLAGKKGCKRPVYKPAYCLLTCAYVGAYIAAYLPFTEKAGRDF